MQLSKVDISGELRVTYTNGGEEVWDKQIDLFANTTKVRIMNDFYELHWFDLINGSEFGASVGTDIAIANIHVGVGTGADTTFSGTLGPLPIKAGTTTFTYTTGGTVRTATTDATGAVTGVGISAGTVNQTTGVYSLTYSTAPDDSTPITASLIRGTVADDSIVTGFTFELSTTEAPTLTEGLFLNPVTLTVAPKKMDRYEQNGYIIYETVMTATYTGAATPAVTGVGIHYVASTGTSAGADIADNFLIKSVAPNANPIYGANGLILSNECDITLSYRIKVSKK